MSHVLLREILGPSFDDMPETVQKMHGTEHTRKVQRIAKVVGGKNPIASAIRILARLPQPTRRARVHIDFVKDGESER